MLKLARRIVQRGDACAELVESDGPLRRATSQLKHVAAPNFTEYLQLRLGNLPHAPSVAARGGELRAMLLLILRGQPVPELSIPCGVIRIAHGLTLSHGYRNPSAA